MMNLFYLILVFIFFYTDISIMRRLQASLFGRVFFVPRWIWGVYVVLLAGLCWYSGQEMSVPFILLVFIFPVYLIKRSRFYKELAVLGQSLDAPPGLRLAADTITTVINWAVVMVLVSLTVHGAGMVFPSVKSPLGEMVVLAAAGSLLMVLFIYRMVRTRKYPGVSFARMTGLERPVVKQPFWKFYLLPLAVSLVMASLSAQLIFSRTVQPDTPLSAAIDATASIQVLLIFMGVAVLLAPFFEEIIFRGCFFYVIREVKGERYALYTIALLFGLMHADQYWGDWAAIAVVTLLGFLLTLLRVWNGSTIPGIIAHYVYNGAVTVIPVVMLILAHPSFFEFQRRYDRIDFAKREALLRQSLREDPHHGESYNALAWIYAEAGKNLNEALLLADRALSIDPQRAAYIDTKAEVLFKMGKTASAIELAEDLVGRFPDDDYFRQQLEKFQEAPAGNK